MNAVCAAPSGARATPFGGAEASTYVPSIAVWLSTVPRAGTARPLKQQSSTTIRLSAPQSDTTSRSTSYSSPLTRSSARSVSAIARNSSPRVPSSP
ncbi:hypothetical protein SALBM311S_01215 [Streptomyces alboniger]